MWKEWLGDFCSYVSGNGWKVGFLWKVMEVCGRKWKGDEELDFIDYEVGFFDFFDKREKDCLNLNIVFNFVKV